MSRKIGLWLIGAYGGVSTTVAVGLSALKQQLMDNCGLVSSLPQFRFLNLVEWDQVVIGGHEIRQSDFVNEAGGLSRHPNPVISGHIVERCLDDLKTMDQSVKPGILCNSGAAIEKLGSPQYSTVYQSGSLAIQQIQQDLVEFQSHHGCELVIVVNLASTEPAMDVSNLPSTWLELEKSIDSDLCNLPASSLYAIAALKSKMPFVNFTPSLGNDLPAIHDLANQQEVCHMGHDGKTGETFLKSVLAPAFAQRNLQIMSWVGHNIFGNMDGQVLDDPTNKETKVTSKGRMLEHMLGYQPQSHISIEYIQSLGDWKTAWDHIHFQGFLGTPMTMQFTWQGCDSILAAPLVLDLFRFTERAQRTGETGVLSFLSSFFKSPMGTDEHDFAKQFQSLVEWSQSHAEVDSAAQ